MAPRLSRHFSYRQFESSSVVSLPRAPIAEQSIAHSHNKYPFLAQEIAFEVALRARRCCCLRGAVSRQPLVEHPTKCSRQAERDTFLVGRSDDVYWRPKAFHSLHPRHVAAHKQHSAPAAAGHRNLSLPALCSAIARAERARSYSYHVHDVQQRFRGTHMTEALEKPTRCGKKRCF